MIINNDNNFHFAAMVYNNRSHVKCMLFISRIMKGHKEQVSTCDIVVLKDVNLRKRVDRSFICISAMFVSIRLPQPNDSCTFVAVPWSAQGGFGFGLRSLRTSRHLIAPSDTHTDDAYRLLAVRIVVSLSVHASDLITPRVVYACVT